MKYTITAFLFFLLVQISPSQENQQKYIAPTDSLVIKKLAQWSNLKFGLLMHWGAYSQWGIVESWSICPEDEEWCARKGVYSKDYSEYKKQYEKPEGIRNNKQQRTNFECRYFQKSGYYFSGTISF